MQSFLFEQNYIHVVWKSNEYIHQEEEEYRSSAIQLFSSDVTECLVCYRVEFEVCKFQMRKFSNSV